MTTERRRCVCHGTIEAEPDPLSIGHAVQQHQRTEQHREFIDKLLIAVNFQVPSLPVSVRKVK